MEPAHTVGAVGAHARRLAGVYADGAARALLGPLVGVEAEIAASLRPGLEHSVAHARLAWWQDECERLRNGSPAHPLTARLRASAADPESLGELGGLVDNARWDLARATFEDEAELEAYLHRWSGAMIRPLLRAAQVAAAPGEEVLLRAAGALREIELLIGFTRELRAGRLRVPLAALAEADIAPEPLQGPAPAPPALPGLLAQRHEAARGRLEPLRAALREGTHPRALRVWLELAARASRRAAQTRPEALGDVTLLGIGAAWHAWRAALGAPG